MWKGYYLINWRYTKTRDYSHSLLTKRIPFLSKMVYKRVRGWTSGRCFPVYNFVECPLRPPPPPPLRALIVSRYWVSLLHRQLSITCNQSGWSSSSESSQWENRTLKSFLRCWRNLFSIMSTVSSSPCIGGEAEKKQFSRSWHPANSAHASVTHIYRFSKTLITLQLLKPTSKCVLKQFSLCQISIRIYYISPRSSYSFRWWF